MPLGSGVIEVQENFGEEDRALIPHQPTNDSDDEGDISNGEYWGEIEDGVVEGDLPIQSNEVHELQQASQTQNKALGLVNVLLVMLAKWLYRYNITQNAFNSLLKLLGLFFSALCTLFPLLRPVLSLFPVSVCAFKKALSINEKQFYSVCGLCFLPYSL